MCLQYRALRLRKSIARCRDRLPSQRFKRNSACNTFDHEQDLLAFSAVAQRVEALQEAGNSSELLSLSQEGLTWVCTREVANVVEGNPEQISHCRYKKLTSPLSRVGQYLDWKYSCGLVVTTLDLQVEGCVMDLYSTGLEVTPSGAPTLKHPAGSQLGHVPNSLHEA